MRTRMLGIRSMTVQNQPGCSHARRRSVQFPYSDFTASRGLRGITGDNRSPARSGFFGEPLRDGDNAYLTYRTCNRLLLRGLRQSL